MSHKNGGFFKCEYCGKEFYRSKSYIALGRTHYCNSECAKKAIAEREKKGKWYTCPICGKAFYRADCYTTRSQVQYCSRECFKAVSSPRMTRMNEELNPTRMTDGTKEKLRDYRLENGGGLREDGYKKLYSKLEHRVVAEQMLGRSLRKGEVVHHINGDRHDNRPENLMVFASQSEHSQWHAKHGKRRWK